MDTQAIFKNAPFGGFDRSSVLKFIGDLNEKNRQSETELNKKIEDLTRENVELTRNLEAVNSSNMSAQEKFQNNQIELKEKEMYIDKLEREIAGYKKLAADRERELQIELERNKQLQFKCESLEYKGKKFEETSMHLGTILIDAKNNAQKIIEEATIKAQYKHSDAVKAMETVLSELKLFKQDVEVTKSIISNSFSETQNRLVVIENAISNAENELEKTQELIESTKQANIAFVNEYKNNMDIENIRTEEVEEGFFRTSAR